LGCPLACLNITPLEHTRVVIITPFECYFSVFFVTPLGVLRQLLLKIIILGDGVIIIMEEKSMQFMEILIYKDL